MFRGHEGILMCDKCFGLIKDKLGMIHLKYNKNIKLCDCKECRRYYAIKIDKNIFNIVQALNLKGYYTGGSCEGAGSRGMIVVFKQFDKNVKIKTKGIPDGFKFNKSMLCSTKIDYKNPKEKREDYQRILDWINNNLESIG